MFSIEVALITVLLILVIWLYQLPMKIAKNRAHPARQAIMVLTIVSLFFLWPLWIVALCWALNGQGNISAKTLFLDRAWVHGWRWM